MTKTPLILATSILVLTASAAVSGGHGGNPAVKARQSHMQLYAHNLGILGGMAKGEVDYDAAAASAAASNLATLSKLDQRSYWVPGTSTDDLGDETRALPAIWAADSKAFEISGQLAEAATAMAAVAGNGQGELGAALGEVGKSCGSCHKAYQQPK